ncbi:MAG: hypothetical protein ABSF11_10360 [Methylocella sp.]|jgi:hypothetical protein
MREAWKGVDGGSRDFRPVSKLLNAIKADLRTESINVVNFPVLNWCLLLDEFIVFFSMIFLRLRGGNETSDAKELVIKFCCGSLCAQIGCIRSVVMAGFDVQARALCRILGEHIDLATVLINDPLLCAEFKAAEEQEQANRFWHKNLSKGKLKKRLYDSVVTVDGELQQLLNEIREYEKQEELMQSSALHPSYTGIAMPAFSGASYGLAPMGIFGVVDSLSVRPLAYAFHKCSFLILFRYPRWLELLPQLKEFDAEDTAKRLEFLLRLSTYVSDHQDEYPLKSAIESEG